MQVRAKRAELIRERTARDADLIRARCKTFAGFVREAWPILEPFTTLVWNWHLDAMCEHAEAITRGQMEPRLVANVPPGSSKALDEDTLILTTWGWTRHGDLAPGDFVFGPDGLPKRVIACTEPWTEDAFSVEFDDRSRIIASGDHLWAVERERVDRETRWKRRRDGRIIATRDLLTKENTRGTHGRADRIPVACPVALPPRRLLIEPYLLGAWLGDGASAAGTIYSAEQDIETMGPLGRIAHTLKMGGARTQDFHRIAIKGLSLNLRALGLMNNKHIPDDYLEASIEQRFALLQGLMDTDGSATKGGECGFVTKSRALADQVASLVCSLGMKAFVAERRAILRGVDYGPAYRVGFTAAPGATIFRIPRKQARVRHASAPRTRSRYVAEVRPVGSRRVKCIQVEGSIYLAGRELIPTHNSTIFSVMWQAWEWGPCDLPGLKYLSTSFELGNVTRDTRKTRDLIMSEWFQLLWPRPLTRQGETSFENEARGTREGVAFTSLTAKRGDRLVIDDPHSLDGAESEAERDKATRRFIEGGQNRLNDQLKSAIVIVMQRLHERDLAGVVLSREMGFVHLLIPMEYEPERRIVTPIGWTDPRKLDGELMDPRRMPEKALKPLRDSEYSYAGQYQQRPAPREGGLFKVEKIEIVDLAEVPAGGQTVRGWDLAATSQPKAGSKRKTSARTAAVRIKRVGGMLYIEHAVARRASPNEVEQLVLSTAGDDTVTILQSLPQDPGQAGLAQKLRYAELLEGFNFRITPEVGSKEERAVPFAAQVEAGRVKLVRGDWNASYLDELRNFPNGALKDQVDASTRAFQELLKFDSHEGIFGASQMFAANGTAVL